MKLMRVTASLLDMRSRPDHAAERVNQVLFDDLLLVSSKRSGFAMVKKADGYRGWVDARFVCDASKKKRRSSTAIVIARETRLTRTRSGQSVWPHRLYYGTTVRLSGRVADGRQGIVAPDGEELMIRSSALARVGKRQSRSYRASRPKHEARKFLGTPYLWGGVTTCGCDCSGLVQTVFAVVGMELPRDTKDQIRSGSAVSPKDIQAGDLLFFDRHVAMAISRHRFIHSSRASSGVAIESLHPKHQTYRSDLHARFVCARRIL